MKDAAKRETVIRIAGFCESSTFPTCYTGFDFNPGTFDRVATLNTTKKGFGVSLDVEGTISSLEAKAIPELRTAVLETIKGAFSRGLSEESLFKSLMSGIHYSRRRCVKSVILVYGYPII